MKITSRIYALFMVVTFILGLPVLVAAHDEPRKEQLRALEKVRISPMQAVSNIESASRARVVMLEIEPKLKPLNLRKGPVVYELVTVKNRTMKAYFVDVVSGKVLGELDDWFGLLHFLSISKSDAFGEAKIPLAQAMGLAEKETGAKTVSAKAKVKHDVLYYEIIMRVSNASKRVYVNATNGRVSDKARAKDGHIED